MAAILAFPLAGVTPASAASTTWAATATRAETLVGATHLGATAPTTPLRISVALNLRSQPQLQHVIASGTVLSRNQFVASYAPTAASTKAVASYLSSHGFTNVAVAANRLLVTASGTAATAESAFHTSIENYRQHGHTVFANTQAAQVPAALASTVGAVLGLNNAAKMNAGATKTTATNPPSDCVVTGVGYPCTYNPQGLWQAYDATTAPTGAHTKIAIFAEGDVSGVVTDLRAEETANGLNQVPVTIEPTGPASSDTSGLDEWDMDTQYSSGMAATVSQLYIYDAATLNDPDITSELNQFAADDTAVAGSASFGECEFQAYLDGSMLADDEVFAEAAAQGQTVFSSAGDTGGFCPVGVGENGVPAGVPDVNYPASSPFVVGAGGTTLVTNSDGSYDVEAAWVAGGGGPSIFESAPAWQSGIAPPTGTVCSALVDLPCGRAVPDIAMDADPNSGANVYVAGTPEGVGGTSLSSPLALGVWARIESAHQNAVGFAGPALYAAHATAAFHDIILGDTGPYPATPGADFATGIGTFDVAQAASLVH
ncbi:MAG TPA: S53 family peptidase [Acidimicrobiia bacterium]